MSEGLRIAMWSGPRNISTAMMRAWGSRADTAVIDEPLYAHYLVRTGVEHPGRDAIIASQSADATAVTAMLTGPVPGGKAIWYQKHMTQHVLEDMPLDWLDDLEHCFLIRAPEQVAASFTRTRPDAAAWELGFAQQTRLFGHVCQRRGSAPPVVDAEDVLKDPPGVLRALCRRLGVDFSERMLRWPAGGRDEDGVWAPHWYHAVEHSTGFQPWRPREPGLDASQRQLADACRPSYQRLAPYRLKGDA